MESEMSAVLSLFLMIQLDNVEYDYILFLIVSCFDAES